MARELTLNALKIMAALHQNGETYPLHLSRSTGVSIGSLYFLLDQLRELGLVTDTWEEAASNRPPRRYHRLTSAGEERFLQERARLASQLGLTV